MKSNCFPIEHKGVFIHKYNTNDENVKGDFFSIGHFKSEPLIDEEEAMAFGVALSHYQDVLKLHGAKQYHHQFVYAKDDVKDVQDSYFQSVEECKNAIDALNNNK